MTKANKKFKQKNQKLNKLSRPSKFFNHPWKKELTKKNLREWFVRTTLFIYLGESFSRFPIGVCYHILQTYYDAIVLFSDPLPVPLAVLPCARLSYRNNGRILITELLIFFSD